MTNALKTNEVRFENLKGGTVVGFTGSFLGYDKIQIELPNGKLVTVIPAKYNMIVTYDEKFVETNPAR